MNWMTASGIHNSMTKAGVEAAFIGMATMGMAIPANAMPGFAGTPETPVPLQEPKPDCASAPTDPACGEHPYTVLTPGNVPLPIPVWPTEPPVNP